MSVIERRETVELTRVDSLPEASIDITVMAFGPGRLGSVQSMYLKNKDCSVTKVAQSRMFDAGEIVVDLNVDGAVIGVECLNFVRNSESVPEFMEFATALISKDRPFAFASAALSMHLWDAFNCGLQILEGAISVLDLDDERRGNLISALLAAPALCHQETNWRENNSPVWSRSAANGLVEA